LIEKRIIRVLSEKLIELSRQEGKMEEIGQELSKAREVLLRKLPWRILHHPRLDLSSRKEIAKNLLTKIRLSSLTIYFITTLIELDYLRLLPKIVGFYEGLCDKIQGRVKAEVTTAIPLLEDQKLQLRQRLERVIGSKVRLVQRVDPGILGGLRVKVRDKVMDNSIRSQLHRLRETLIS
jgi:F-type H+-transporting ATPase subunit delta